MPLNGRLDLTCLDAISADHPPGLVVYTKNPRDGGLDACGLMIFAIDGEQTSLITGFAHQPELFDRLDLPRRLPASLYVARG